MSDDRCQWFAYCDERAEILVAHPVLGDVPTCTRCADKLGLTYTVRLDDDCG